MINDFVDFCLWMYVIVDDIWQPIAPFFKRPGPAPLCSDSELLTMVLVGECRGWVVETEMLAYWREQRHLLPIIPSQSRFNRRRRHLLQAFNLIRRVVLQMLDLAQDRQCVIDSLPIPVVQFYLVPGSTGDWRAYGATFGKVPSKKQTIFGYKLHLLITLGGLILDFELAPANVTDLEVGFELLSEHTDLEVLGDKGYISATKAAELWHHNHLRLRTYPAAIRRNSCLSPCAVCSMPSGSADDERRHHLPPACPAELGRRQRCRQRARRRMHDPCDMRVVIIEAVTQIAVHDRRIPRRQPGRHPEHGNRALTRQRPNARKGLVRKIIPGRGDRDTSRIQHVVDGSRAHLCGDFTVVKVRGKIRELRLDGPLGLHPGTGRIDLRLIVHFRSPAGPWPLSS